MPRTEARTTSSRVATNRTTDKANKTRRRRGNYKAREATGIIRSDESFTSDAFIERLGITRARFAEMRRRGLVARRDGGRVRVLGADYLAYLQACPPAELNELDRG